jgi:hypothetical protein
MGSKISYKVGSAIPFHANCEVNELACISCGKEPKPNTCWKWEVYVIDGHFISTEWTEPEMSLLYVCDTCSVKFDDEIITEGS